MNLCFGMNEKGSASLLEMLEHYSCILHVMPGCKEQFICVPVLTYP